MVLPNAPFLLANILQVYNREKFPERWADTQSNLENAYFEISYSEKPEIL